MYSNKCIMPCKAVDSRYELPLRIVPLYVNHLSELPNNPVHKTVRDTALSTAIIMVQMITQNHYC